MRFSPVLFSIGIMLVLLGAAMLPCALIAFHDGEENWPTFALWGFATGAIGGVIAVASGGSRADTGQREAFLLTVMVWVVLSLAAALPFLSFGYGVVDALFESISGLTTTGATVLTGLDDMSRGLLLWRAILQWIGGIGIIVTAIAVLPGLQVGGMQLFQVESSDQTGKFMPRVAEIAGQVGKVYLILSVLCAVSYGLAGMTPFNAIAHAMTTMAAGGYSTHDASLGQYSGTPVIWVGIVFMTLAGLPFSLLALTILQVRVSALLRDPQPRLFLALALVFTLVIVTYHQFDVAPPTFDNNIEAFRETLFNIISVMTGTGYASAGYDSWGALAVVVFFIATFVGGCAGSAACGIKMFRLEISAKAVLAYARRMVRPNRVTAIRYGGKPVNDDTLQSVMVFLFLFVSTFAIAALLLNLAGNDFITSVSAAAASVSNVGPGLGEVVGPDGTYQSLNTVSKIVCSLAMLLGRLEFIAVFVVLMPRFWRD